MITTVLQQEESKQPRGRVEDRRLLTGAGHFVDDLNVLNQAYMGFVLSPFAHAKIKSIDLSKVRASPEFIAALTGADLVQAGVHPVDQNPFPPQKKAKRYHLAVDKVRFVGEPVVAILVRNMSSLEDLIDLVDVEYEQLPVVTTIEESKNLKARIYEDWKDNLSQTGEEKKGDADKALSSAAYVVTARLGIKRQEAAPIETHSVLVSYDKETDVFEVNATVQSVHGLLGHLTSELGMPRNKFHVKVMDMGGGFGTKGGPSYPWPVLACLFAKNTGLPVKWSASRTEEFLESAPGRDEYCDVTLGCDRDGRMVALKANVDCDVGVSGTQMHMPSFTISTMLGPYNIPNLDLSVAAYVTNKMPIGPVRGAGAPEGCYFIERISEIMAKKIGLDPIEFRRRNLEAHANNENGLQGLLDTLIKVSEYESLLKWRNSLLSKLGHDSNLVAGIGISVHGTDEPDDEEIEGEVLEEASWTTSNRDDSSEEESESGAFSFMTESAKVTLDTGGNLTIYTGSSPHGQGHETAFAQLASEELGIPLENIRVVWGDTTLIPLGMGTFGSRSAATGGSAVIDASRKMRARILRSVSKILGRDPKSLRMLNGNIFDASNLDKPLSTIREILQELGKTEISANSRYTLSAMSESSGVQLCAVTLDVETGSVKIEKYVVVEDCGRIINRAIVDGQFHGGVIHGVGGALLESLAYDESGNLLTSTFIDYSIPTSVDSPDVEVFYKTTPSKAALNGAKGVGESGTNASYGAVINAVNDALSQLGKEKEANIAPTLPDIIYEDALKNSV